MDLDPGIPNRTDGDWKGEALQQREVDMDVEPLCLEGSEAPGDGLEAARARLEGSAYLRQIGRGHRCRAAQDRGR